MVPISLQEALTRKKIVQQIEKNLNGVSVLCFMGTWCGDSKRETPRFYKIMEEANFDFKKNFKVIALNRAKKLQQSSKRLQYC